MRLISRTCGPRRLGIFDARAHGLTAADDTIIAATRRVGLVALGMIDGLLAAVMLWLAIDLRHADFAASRSWREFIRYWPHTEIGWSYVFGTIACIGLMSFVPRMPYQVKALCLLTLCVMHLRVGIGMHDSYAAGTSYGVYGILATVALIRAGMIPAVRR